MSPINGDGGVATFKRLKLCYGSDALSRLAQAPWSCGELPVTVGRLLACGLVNALAAQGLQRVALDWAQMVSG